MQPPTSSEGRGEGDAGDGGRRGSEGASGAEGSDNEEGSGSAATVDAAVATATVAAAAVADTAHADIAAAEGSAVTAAAAGVAGDSVESSEATAAAIVGLLPLVLALADTVEGARCLVSMLAAGRGVGLAAQAAILWQHLSVDDDLATAAVATGSDSAVGVQSVVRMLVSCGVSFAAQTRLCYVGPGGGRDQ